MHRVLSYPASLSPVISLNPHPTQLRLPLRTPTPSKSRTCIPSTSPVSPRLILPPLHSTGKEIIPEVELAERRDHPGLKSINSVDKKLVHNKLAGAGGRYEPQYPPTVDWREEGVLTPVVNTELGLNLCVPTCVATVIESAHCIATNELLELSIQELIDGNYPLASRKTGWFADRSLRYAQKYGIHLAEDYPFVGKGPGYCMSEELNKKRKIFISDYHMLLAPPVPIMKAIIARQPVVAVVFYDILQEYTRGVVLKDACPKLRTHPGNHCIVLVGYKTEGRMDYFIAKDNKGKEWGERGNFRIESTYFKRVLNHSLYYPIVTEDSSKGKENLPICTGCDPCLEADAKPGIRIRGYA